MSVICTIIEVLLLCIRAIKEGAMSWHKPQFYTSVAEYLASEKDSPVRHEYVDGQMYAMAGASDRHNRIALNLASRLNDHLNGGPCEVFIADMKVIVDPVVYYYPDVAVTCDPPGGDPYIRTQPRLIIEVVFPSTERIDRHEKLFAYRRVSSLQEYVLVLQDRMQVEVYRRQSEDEWIREIFTQPGEHVHFSSVDFTLSVNDIYRNVRWSESATN
jgi:Uma2 family endonuclease